MAPPHDYHAFEREIDSWRIRRKDADDQKSYDEVFDKPNLMVIYKLFSDGVLDRLDFPIATGKEGNVFRASTRDGGLLAVKIYRTTTSTFRDMAKYIHGDPRFDGLGGRKRKLIFMWAMKEFLNLKQLYKAGVRVPKPVAQRRNVVVMEYIGNETEPARELRNVKLRDPEPVARKLLDYIKLAYRKAKLVHSDISEFNVLMLDGKPVIIDVGQAVMLGHPLAQEWLERDVSNVARYFRRYDVKIEVAKELKEIRKQ
ncbi:MAG: serine protein kinase RIO [Thermoplasmata archaeon]